MYKYLAGSRKDISVVLRECQSAGEARRREERSTARTRVVRLQSTDRAGSLRIHSSTVL